MPFYEYACKACNHQFEVMQGINEAALVKCPACNKRKLQKLVSAPSFQLRGTGWYVTDFKNSGQKPKTETKAKPETAGDKKVDAKSSDSSSTKTTTSDK